MHGDLDMDAIGKFIVAKEGRRDSKGRLRWYPLPPGDGGGTFEVAGINDRYHANKAWELRNWIDTGCANRAEEEAGKYLMHYTNGVVNWHPDIRVRAFLRDCAFNRGPRGAALILQQALIVAGTYKGKLDGRAGLGTRSAAEQHTAEDLVFRLLLSRQWYERRKRDESSPFWAGLTNRWVDAAQLALQIGDPLKFGK